MAPKYKLTYFNVAALGEPIRYLFAYGKIDFEDNRIDREDWAKMKSETAWGKLPMLEVDGKEVYQSGAICRYISKIVGLNGKSDWDALQADMVVGVLEDLREYLVSYFRESDETLKANKLKDLKEVQFPFFLPRLEKMVSENGGYFVNGQLTWADLYFATFIFTLEGFLKEMKILEKSPKLQALKTKVENLPGIKEYIAKRPPPMQT